jgi:hypothetical protein
MSRRWVCLRIVTRQMSVSKDGDKTYECAKFGDMTDGWVRVGNREWHFISYVYLDILSRIVCAVRLCTHIPWIFGSNISCYPGMFTQDYSPTMEILGPPWLDNGHTFPKHYSPIYSFHSVKANYWNRRWIAHNMKEIESVVYSWISSWRLLCTLNLSSLECVTGFGLNISSRGQHVPGDGLYLLRVFFVVLRSSELINFHSN